MKTIVHGQPALGDYLLREGMITQLQLNQALEEQLKSRRSVGRILVDKGYITEKLLMAVLQKHFGFHVVHLHEAGIERSLLARIPYGFAEKHRVVPVRLDEDNVLLVAMEDPTDLVVADALKNQLGLQIRPVVTTHEEIQAVLDQYGAQQQAQRAAPAPGGSEPGRLYHVLKLTAFPVLTFGPILFFFAGLHHNIGGLLDAFQELYGQGNLSVFDLTIYIALTWGLWTVILFELNGLIFGRGRNRASHAAE